MRKTPTQIRKVVELAVHSVRWADNEVVGTVVEREDATMLRVEICKLEAATSDLRRTLANAEKPS